MRMPTKCSKECDQNVEKSAPLSCLKYIIKVYDDFESKKFSVFHSGY